MIKLIKARLLAADLLGCAPGRVLFKLIRNADADDKKIVTRAQVKQLIAKKEIVKRRVVGISRNEIRITAPTRTKKDLWMRRVRRLRAALKQLNLSGVAHRRAYLAIKSGHIVSRHGLKVYVQC